MSVEIRSCRAEEFERLIALLDEEFIFAKGRTISLQQRFPAVYCDANLHNIWVVITDSEIVSALVIRQFDWLAQQRKFRGAMIGGVYTHPAHRKKGWASHLLDTATTHLRKAGVDFGVLWTSQHEFYARLGWVSTDKSVLGEFVPHNKSSAKTSLVLSRDFDVQQLEKIRSETLPNLLMRSPTAYRHLPLPAENIEVLLQKNQSGSACAILGNTGEVGFLYELTGALACFPNLWAEICERYQKIWINDQRGNPSFTWLSTQINVSWEDKNLAMWLPLSERVNKPAFEQWHIPYFDRI